MDIFLSTQLFYAPKFKSTSIMTKQLHIILRLIPTKTIFRFFFAYYLNEKAIKRYKSNVLLYF